jgi:hypothetical protein
MRKINPEIGRLTDMLKVCSRAVVFNREPTPLDFIADLVINAEIGPTLGTAVGIE